MRSPRAGGGVRAIWYALAKARKAGGFRAMYRALRTPNACKTCALGMGGQLGGMVNETGHFPEVCKKSIQAMAADMQGAVPSHFFDEHSFDDLAAWTPRQLESAGRLTTPLYAGPLDLTYRPIGWEEAIEKVAGSLNETHPERTFFYVSGRSSNEAGFLIQLLSRVYGTNNVNNCSYYCHQASGVGLASVTGSGTATVVLEDIENLGSGDVFFVVGANPASNHPRMMTLLANLKKRGGKVVVINPLRETGLVRFKVPSKPWSLLFGTTIADIYLQPRIGGDIALLSGIAKAVIANDQHDSVFLENHCSGWPEVRSHLENMPWPDIENASGVDRASIEAAASVYSSAPNAIFSWAMGITHHRHGVENVQAIANLALIRGMAGRSGAGLLPIRGHSNVQGIGSVGVTPQLKESVWNALNRELGVTPPSDSGLDTMASMLAADGHEIDFGLCLGGNLFGSNPDAAFASRALGKIGTVVYMSTTLNTGHIHGRGKETIVLPVLARDEEPQSTTQESMFNYVRLSDGGAPRHTGPRSEVDVIATIGAKVTHADAIDWQGFADHDNIRDAIAKVIPGYRAISEIGATKEEFQIEGRTFHTPEFATDDGRAQMHVVDLPDLPDPGALRLMTVRSEGQFNTVVYEEEDLYRGQDRRDVILLNPGDIAALGLSENQRVKVVGEAGFLDNILVRPIDVARGSAVMYYPEANVLLPRTVDPSSRTPAFKNTPITLEPSNPG